MKTFYIVTNQSKDSELKYTNSIITYLNEHVRMVYMMRLRAGLRELSIVTLMQDLCLTVLTVL